MATTNQENKRKVACCANEDELQTENKKPKSLQTKIDAFIKPKGIPQVKESAELSRKKVQLIEPHILESPLMEVWRQRLGNSWYEALGTELSSQYFVSCVDAVEKQRDALKKVYPPKELVFNAFKTTPLDEIRVVIVGQDPYHQPRQAMGLCFSVPRGVPPPPSLKNMFKEIGCESWHGDLTTWAQQGVFMLNSLLTVVEGSPMSHKDLGWARFTDRVIDVIDKKCKDVIFMLWGKPAQKKASRVDRTKHHVLEAGHPSPLSIKHFQGCQHFKKCNELLRKSGRPEICWTLPQ